MRLGVKRFGGQFVTAGSILVRQRGRRSTQGKMLALVEMTLFAKIDGVVVFENKFGGKKQVSVQPAVAGK